MRIKGISLRVKEHEFDLAVGIENKIRVEIIEWQLIVHIFKMTESTVEADFFSKRVLKYLLDKFELNFNP